MKNQGGLFETKWSHWSQKTAFGMEDQAQDRWLFKAAVFAMQCDVQVHHKALREGH